MPSLCLYFKVHQPFQLKQYHAQDIEVDHCYEDAASDEAVINRLADTSYLPSNKVLLSLIKENLGRFSLTFSMSGTVLELLQRYRPDVIGSFQELTNTGCVEILAETYYHSLSYLHSTDEFERQVRQHGMLVKMLFGLEPRIFRNTELIYNNGMAARISRMGFDGILCEGIDHILQGRSPNHVYHSPGEEKARLLLRNAALSDDIAFRFDDPSWSEYPLTAEKMAEWIHNHPEGDEAINLFMDYETFGIHKNDETGIFDFLKALPEKVLANPAFHFDMPSRVIKKYGAQDVYDVSQTISWEGRSASGEAWSQNVMQNNTLKKIYSLNKMVLASGSAKTLATWGKLQAADYFYYMLEEHAKGDTYKYINPFNSSEEVFRYYTNIVVDFEIGLIRAAIMARRKKTLTKGWSLLNNN